MGTGNDSILKSVTTTREEEQHARVGACLFSVVTSSFTLSGLGSLVDRAVRPSVVAGSAARALRFLRERSHASVASET